MNAGVKKNSLLWMVSLLFTTQACTDIFLPGLPLIAKEFDTTINITNLMVSVYSYSQAIVVLWIGIVSDLRGRRATILACLALHIMATICIALSSSLFLIIVLRALQAVGSAAVYIVSRLIIKDTMDKKAQIHATGSLVLGLVLSPLLAPVVGAWIIQLSTWRNCFWAIAIVELPLLLWVLMTFEETNKKQFEFRSSFSFKKHLLSYCLLLKDYFFLGQSLIVGSVFAAFYAFIGISSYMYIDQYGIKETDYSYAFIPIALFYLGGNRLMRMLNAKNTLPQRIVEYGIYVSLIGTAFIIAEAVSKSTLVAVILATLGACLLRLATALINPPIQVVITNHFGARGSAALGLLTCIQYSFGAIGALIVSGLPFKPSNNFMFTTLVFAALSFIGLEVASRIRTDG